MPATSPTRRAERHVLVPYSGGCIQAKALLIAAAIIGLYASPAQAAHPHIDVGCNHAVSAQQGLATAVAVWPPKRWHRKWPKHSAITAHRQQVRCAKGPGHRAAIQRSWEVHRHRFYEHQHYCRSGIVITGRVSYFGGGLEASGHYTSEPGIALNIAPGSESGWNNSTTRGWLSGLQRFWVTIDGHRAVLPVTDLGPAGFTQRAIDVTEGGVAALGLSGAFPTDVIGTAKLIPDGCA